jgi:hypothetical protein
MRGQPRRRMQSYLPLLLADQRVGEQLVFERFPGRDENCTLQWRIVRFEATPIDREFFIPWLGRRNADKIELFTKLPEDPRPRRPATGPREGLGGITLRFQGGINVLTVAKGNAGFQEQHALRVLTEEG